MSNRKTSDIQFENNVIINTADVQEYLNDVVDAVNNVGPDVDASSWVPFNYVTGHTERRWDWNQVNAGIYTLREPPFMPAYASDVTIPSSSLRLKGYNPLGILVGPRSLATTSSVDYADNAFISEFAYWTQEPQIINDFHIHMQSDIDFVARISEDGLCSDVWYWTSGSPHPDLANTSFVEDIAVQIVIDSQLDPQNAEQTVIELNKGMFSADSQFTSASKLWGSDMLPNTAGLIGDEHDVRVWGLTVGAQGMNISIPAKSRVRFIIVIPDWSRIANAFSEAENRWTELDQPSFMGTPDWPNVAWRLQKYTTTINGFERRKAK